MSAWLDKKYLNLISVRLERFVWKNANLANHRCNICGDSQKNKLKARGFHFLKKGGMFYDCKNCNASMSTANFIKMVDPELHKEYVMERFMAGENKYSNYKKPTAQDFGFDTRPLFKEKSLLEGLMEAVDTLPDDHIAKRYVIARMIPEERWSELYYLDDTQKLQGMASEASQAKYNTHEPRLVIPFYGRDGKLKGVTARALEDSEQYKRYLAVRINPEAPLIYNLDRLDFGQKIYVTEGPVDSMFLPNSCASGNTNLTIVKDHMPKDRCVLIFDYQPRNAELVSIVRKAIKQNFAVALLPSTFPGKDINAAVVNGGMSPEEIKQIIDDNTYRGLSAEVEFARWSKIKR